MKHYLDYNATAPLRPEVLALMQELQALPLNASSVHAMGRKAKGIIEDARRLIAENIGAFTGEVIFTASGTEANNWALCAFPGRAAFISSIEHPSVLKAAGRAEVVPVTQDGAIDLAALEGVLPDEGGNFLLSLMLANNETGVIQPVREAADIVHKRGGLLHCDAVQALGKVPVNFTDLGSDLMTISAHKMGGPVGAAALVVKSNLGVAPMLLGGGQELNRRAGTENIVAIAGFAKAVELIDFSHMRALRGWLDALEGRLQNVSRETLLLGKSAARLPNTLCLTMPGVSAETQLISFDLGGIAVSAGAACSSGRIEPSHVLKAMGIDPKTVATAIRISGGWATTEQDIESVGQAWEALFKSKKAA